MPPARKSVLLPVLMALAALGTAPFAFVGREPFNVLGIPLWLWSSFGCTVLLAGLTSWWMLRAWPDDDDE